MASDFPALLTDHALVQALEPGLYTALPDVSRATLYDRYAAGYDAFLRWSVYHRLVWGTTVAAYTGFARQALDAAHPGWFAEIGCGSLLFTAGMYWDVPGVRAVLVDRSLPMLRRAQRRLPGAGPANVVAFHGNAAALPFRPGIFSSILCLNLLHVPCAREDIVAECGRLLIPGGRFFVSCLARTGRLWDAFPAFFRWAGALGAPLSPDRVCETAAGSWGRVESRRVEGSMTFIVVRRTAE